MNPGSYTYDKANRLQTVSENNSQVASYAYDANGNRESMTEGPLTTEYAYNLANLVTSLTNKRGTTVLSAYSYTYYLDGNQRTKADNSNKTTTYTYDGLSRLKKEAESGSSDALTLEYTYDRNNNRESMTVSGAESYAVGYAYDDINRLLSTEKTSGGEAETTYYHYDRNGNQISKLTETLSPAGGAPGLSLTNGVVPGFEAFAYDGFNRLISANIGGIDTVYTYNPDGLRHSKSTNNVTTIHVWDGSNISLDIVGSSAVKYVRGINLIASEESGTRKYYLYNAHGDVVKLSSSTGQLLWSYDYDAFGNERNPDDGDVNPWRYCGEYWDVETNTYYLRARYYDQTTGRFLTEDPIRAGLNYYTYCGGNPVMFIDPSGLIDVLLHYIILKNDGESVREQTTILFFVITDGFRVTIGDDTETYYVGDQVRMVNGQPVIDNEILMNDFGLTEAQSLHQEGDPFSSADHAAMAFGFMINPLSINDNLEYGANIYAQDGKYTYRDVVEGSADGVSYKAVNNSYGTRVATIHAHAAYDKNYDNDNFSPADKINAHTRGVNNYVVTPEGYLKKYDINKKKTTTITNVMPYDPLHPKKK